MAADYDWEFVGYGIPPMGESADKMYSGDYEGWHNIEAGAEPPTAEDLRDSTEAVIRSGDNYYTVHVWAFAGEDWDLQDYMDYIDSVFLGEYE